ncbi:MAG TPA: cytidine deaminase [Gaiellales bacterium]|nr:cytidine deaminase [Gaiellales bacterium]
MRAATPEEIELHAEAGRAAVRAHAPYSRFAVGAALRVAGSDRPVLGVNVENASYGLTSCAERNALFTAVAEGHTELWTIAVHADAESAPPCGACRQVMAELAPDLVVVYRRSGELVAAPLAELLPEPFAL